MKILDRPIALPLLILAVSLLGVAVMVLIERLTRPLPANEIWAHACIDSGGTPRTTRGTRNEQIGKHIILCDYPTIEDSKE
jgi:hypothetical protein